jgi:hypothetical protein
MFKACVKTGKYQIFFMKAATGNAHGLHTVAAAIFMTRVHIQLRFLRNMAGMNGDGDIQRPHQYL